MYLFLMKHENFEEFKENKNILVKIKKLMDINARCWKIFKDKFKNELCVRCEKVVDEDFETVNKEFWHL